MASYRNIEDITDLDTRIRIVEIEDDNMRLPIPVVVTIIVLSSLIGIFIVCKAIFGL